MKRELVMGVMLSLLIAGCGAEDSEQVTEPEQEVPATPDSPGDTEDQQPEEGVEEDSAQHPKEKGTVADAVKAQLKTEVPVILPEDLETLMGTGVSAVTQSDRDSYMVEFYRTESGAPVNDPSLGEQQEPFAVFKGTRLGSAEEVAAEINYQDAGESDGLSEVDLGYGITGVREGAAGSQYISWNEGRWSLAVRAMTDQGDNLIEDAKAIVEFLEEHLLPAPQQIGAAQLDATDDGDWNQLIVWQEEDVLYEIMATVDYETALEFAVDN